MATCQQYKDWLVTAEAALGLLLTTGETQLVRYGEKEVRYHPKDAVQVRQWIAYLKKQISQCDSSKRRQLIRIIPVR